MPTQLIVFRLPNNTSLLRLPLFQFETQPDKWGRFMAIVCGMSILQVISSWLIRAIFVWPWNENTWTNRNNKRREIERFDLFIERIKTRVAFGWLSERPDEKASWQRKEFTWKYCVFDRKIGQILMCNCASTIKRYYHIDTLWHKRINRRIFAYVIMFTFWCSNILILQIRYRVKQKSTSIT